MQEDSVVALPDKDINPVFSNGWPGGWKIVKRSIIDFFTNFVPFLLGLLALIPLVIAFVLFYDVNNSFGGLSPLVIGLGAVGIIATIYVGICITAVTPLYGLARADGHKMTVRDIYQFRFILFIKLLAAQLILIIPVFIGFIFLIIPGIVILILLAPTMAIVPYIIAEQKTGPIEGIKRAYALVKPFRGKAYGIYGWFTVLVLVLLIPIILLILAISTAIPAHAADSANTLNGQPNAQNNDTNNSGSGGGGGGAISSIAFAYLYRYIQSQGAQIK